MGRKVWHGRSWAQLGMSCTHKETFKPTAEPMSRGLLPPVMQEKEIQAWGLLDSALSHPGAALDVNH